MHIQLKYINKSKVTLFTFSLSIFKALNQVHFYAHLKEQCRYLRIFFAHANLKNYGSSFSSLSNLIWRTLEKARTALDEGILAEKENTKDEMHRKIGTSSTRECQQVRKVNAPVQCKPLPPSHLGPMLGLAGITNIFSLLLVN